MANRYTNIPGSGGGGPAGCLLKWDLGGGVMFRLGCLGDCGAGWSVNFDPSTGLRDDNSKAGYVEQFDPRFALCNGKVIDANGDWNTFNRGGTLYSRTTQVDVTGQIAKVYTDNLVFRANTWDGYNQASVIVRMRGYAITVAGGGYTLRLENGPDVVPLLVIPAETGASWEVEIHISYDFLNTIPRYAVRGFLDGQPVQITAQNGSFDPTILQAFAVTAQASDDADELESNSCVVVQENTDFCPSSS